MTFDTFRNYCLSLPHASEDFPFDENTLVFRIGGKIFALCNTDLFTSVNLKCDPDKALELREKYPSVRPGYHMNKKHWNTVDVDGITPSDKIREWISHSYDLVRESLPKKEREKLSDKN